MHQHSPAKQEAPRMDGRDALTHSLRQRLSAQMANGDYLAAYDTASDLVAQGDGVPRTRYLKALALARSGATERARSEIEQLAGAASDDPDPVLREDIGALGARLSKDAALRACGSERRRAAAEAARQYEDLHRATGGAYPAINAATLWLLAGDSDSARRLARVVLSSCRDPYPDYWSAASAAEAALVLADVPAAAAALSTAADLSATDPAVRAVTRRQLRLICDALDLNSAVLAPLAQVTVIHYTGHRIAAPASAGRFPADQERSIAERIALQLDRRDVAVAYGSLAAGADVLVAEAILARGAQLHVVLPFAVSTSSPRRSPTAGPTGSTASTAVWSRPSRSPTPTTARTSTTPACSTCQRVSRWETPSCAPALWTPSSCSWPSGTVSSPPTRPARPST
jgi:hypothetical protein